MADIIPLFPLEVVLLPGCLLPLHIFEPRYRQMIARCMKSKEEFGVVLSQGDQVASVGCTAEILKVLLDHPDGRKDILTIGKRRYRLLEILEDQAYLQVRAEWLAAPAPPSSPATAGLLKNYRRCYQLAQGREPNAGEEEAGESVAYQMAQGLPLSLSFKQQLLEEDDELARRAMLEEHLNELLPQLISREGLRKRARGNGHPA